jgi:hypothetical protein
VRSLVGRNPAVSSTMVEATPDSAPHRPIVTENCWTQRAPRDMSIGPGRDKLAKSGTAGWARPSRRTNSR